MEGEYHSDPNEVFFLGPKYRSFGWKDFEAAKGEVNQKLKGVGLLSLNENDNDDALSHWLRPRRYLTNFPPSPVLDNADNDDGSDFEYNPDNDWRPKRAKAAGKPKRKREKKAREQEATGDDEQEDSGDEDGGEEENPPTTSPFYGIPSYVSGHEFEGDLDHNTPLDPEAPEPGDSAARGCKPSFNASTTCTLISTPSSESHWTPCRLITQPARKVPCLSRTAQNSAYVYAQANDVDAASCSNCSIQNKECLAGPLGSMPTVMQLRGDQKRSGSKYLKPCQACRRAKEVCSLTLSRYEKIPCSKCRGNGMQCTFDKVRKRATKGRAGWAKKGKGKGKGKAAKGKSKSRSKKQTNPVYGFEALPSSDADKLAIKTAFSHPLIFNHASTPSDPCSFCSKPSYALHGLGPNLTVEINPDALDIEEISGGYRDRGHAQTRLCDQCTMSRLLINCCDGHELRRIPGYVPLARNRWEQVADDVCEEIPVPKGVRVCSLCVEEGIAECCAEQEMGYGQEAEDAMEGCGLVLCRVCEGRWACFESLDEMIEGARGDEVNYPPGSLRADVGLLTSTGELGMYTRRATGICKEYEVDDGFDGEGDVDITGRSMRVARPFYDDDDDDDAELDFELSLD